MAEHSNRATSTTGSRAPARDRIAIPLLVGLYFAHGIDLLSFETAAMNALLVIGLYQIAA